MLSPQDLTGCPTMKFYFEHESVQDDIKSGKLWESLVRFDRQGYAIHEQIIRIASLMASYPCASNLNRAIMSCSTPGEDTFTEIGGTPQGGPGLVSGHAYTLLQCVETSTGARLEWSHSCLVLTGLAQVRKSSKFEIHGEHSSGTATGVTNRPSGRSS